MKIIEMRLEPCKRVACAVMSICATLALAACTISATSDQSNELERTEDQANDEVIDDGQGSIIVDVDDYLPHADVAELATASDLVIRATLEHAEEDVAIDEVHAGYSIFTLRVDEVLLGEPVEQVRVAVWTHAEGDPIRFIQDGELVAQRFDGTGVWFLTKVEPQFTFEGHVLTNQQGFVRVDDAERLVPSLTGTPFGVEIVELGSLEALEARIREAQ